MREETALEAQDIVFLIDDCHYSFINTRSDMGTFSKYYGIALVFLDDVQKSRGCFCVGLED